MADGVWTAQLYYLGASILRYLNLQFLSLGASAYYIEAFNLILCTRIPF